MKKLIALFTATLSFLFSFCQSEFYNTGSGVYIQQGALVHVQGTVTNDNNSLGANDTFTNNGILEIDGDLNNIDGAKFQYDNSTSSTDRAVKFTGTGIQHIYGSLNSSSAYLYNLVLDQSTSASIVKLEADVTVKGSLVFNSASIFGTPPVVTSVYNPSIPGTNSGNSGMLQIYDDNTGNEYTLDIQNGSTDAIAGYPSLSIDGNPATAYILTKGYAGSSTGGLQRKIGSAASFVYPIGTSLHGYNAVRFNFHTVPGSGNDRVMGKFFNIESSANGVYAGSISTHCTGCTGNSSYLDNAGYNRFFSSNLCNGGTPQWVIIENNAIASHGYWSFTSPNNGSQYQYDIEAFPNNFVTTDGAPNASETWRLLKYDDINDTYGYDPSQADWEPQIEDVSDINDLLTYSMNTGCYSGTGIPGGIYSGFSDFSLGKSQSWDALPVTITALEAYPVNNQYIQVAWTTAVEINNNGFEIQRSTDGINFADLGWVNGHGNSTQVNNYSYNDFDVTPGVVYYYRLVQYDYNGIQTPTNIVQAELSTGDILIVSEPIPNPANNHSRINIITSKQIAVNIKLFNVIGQEISATAHQLTKGNNDINFDTTPLASGTYTAIINADGKNFSRKLIITKQ
ncbi:MAG TPA: T9SS type A sorting domain-containing protein [Chitinophagales bacterium]|nr:T9SS type A sorting domain-containing protein [Chitinophagales bacterium]